MRWPCRSVPCETGAHLRIDLPGGPLRLDIVGDGWPVVPAPLVRLGADLDYQLRAVLRLDALTRGAEPLVPADRTLPRLVLALRAWDARKAGASLRDIGLGLIGGDDWPGDGEHLKSRTRRLVARGEALIRAGPRGVLRSDI